MPSFEIVKQSDIDESSFRVASVKGSFDLDVECIVEKFSGELPIEDKQWDVGIIYGASGTGKTTIAREVFGDNYFVTPKYKEKSVIDDMPKNSSVEKIEKMFTSVGFGSVPSWIKPYNVLSNGEKMRVDLAYSMLTEKDMIVFDEFTSVVDRHIAKIGSMCVQKAVKKMQKKFIAVSCHDDIIDWLEPDWVFDTNTMHFELTKKKDQKSKFRFINVREMNGRHLRDIII